MSSYDKYRTLLHLRLKLACDLNVNLALIIIHICSKLGSVLTSYTWHKKIHWKMQTLKAKQEIHSIHYQEF